MYPNSKRVNLGLLTTSSSVTEIVVHDVVYSERSQLSLNKAIIALATYSMVHFGDSCMAEGKQDG